MPRIDRDTQRDNAKETLALCRVPVGADFHKLDSDQVVALIAAADAERYRAPRNANGSRARYYHAMLERRASRAD